MLLCAHTDFCFRSGTPDGTEEPVLGFASQLVLAAEELPAVLTRVFRPAGTHHGSQNGEEEGGGGHVAGALGEGGDEEAQEEGNGWVRDALQRGQLGAQPGRQARFLQQSREGCQDGEGRAASVFCGSSHASSALPSQSSSQANCRKTQPVLTDRIVQPVKQKKPQHYFPSRDWKVGDPAFMVDY